MYPVSDAFLAALRKSHTVTSRVELWSGTDLLDELVVLSGNVQEDNSALIRRRCGLNLVPTKETLAHLTAGVPSNGGLWPLGNEVRLFSGIKFRNGTVEEVPMGVYRIARPKVSKTVEGITVSVEGFDRSRSVSRNRWTKPMTISAGVNYATAILAIVSDRLPTQSAFDFMDTTYTTPALVFTPDDDPWKMAQDMAASMGAELYFDGLGTCVLRPEPDPVTTPASFVYASGEDATITGLSRDLDDDQAYNGVIVVSENTSNAVPIRAEAWDTDVNSPTYYDPDYPEDSKYGAVPYFMTTQLITTGQQAVDAANANLARVSGIIENIDFAAINNPAQSASDVIAVQDSQVGVDNLYIIDALTTGLGEQFTMSGVTRKRRAS